ncbi:MAG: acetate--CoA ligase family protein, partial [Planctomycetes bacterium]|nr:acetate--CoA ligase family protein [Planctomycetota bacterium]
KNPEVHKIKAYPSILKVPGEVDLAHIVVKNTMVPMVMEECGQKGVKFVIINTAGFKEIGGDGIELEKKIVEIGRKHNIRIFGPNCQGIINTDEKVRAYANFTFARPEAGYISVLAQSGGVGEVIHQRLVDLGTGTRLYASNGNAADISIPEILQYWATDEKTRVIILHIESLADPRAFMKVALEVTKHKPILGMKTGRTELGARAVVSHTGSLMKADTAIEAVFDKCGIISFRNQEELCQAAIGLATQPVPAGPNVGIITNTGGPGIIATDECIEAGLSLPDISEITRNFLKENLFAEASVSNPVDVLATAGPKEYGAAIGALLKDSGIDSVMINFITPFFVDCEGVAKEMVRLAQDASKPILAVIMTDKKRKGEVVKIIKDGGIPVYDLPESASRALGAMTKYGEYQRRPDEKIVGFKDVNKVRVKEIIDQAKKEQREFLLAREVIELLEVYKIPVVESVFINNPEDFRQIADQIKYPVVFKVDSQDVVHKSDQGGVVLGVNNEQQLLKELNDFRAKFTGPDVRFVVQEYLSGGKEIIIGVNQVEGLGHLIMFGLGGIFVEVLKDVSFKIAPLTEHEARGLIQSTKGFAVLKGVRGEAGVDLNKLTEIILRISQLVTDHPEIRELDLNPVLAYNQSGQTKVVDARIRI